MESSPLKLLPSPAKKARTEDFSNCIKCRQNSTDVLRPIGDRMPMFLKSLQTRKAYDDTVGISVYASIKYYLTETSDGTLTLNPSIPTLSIHRNCYATFTSSTNLMRLSNSENLPTDSVTTPRSKREPFDWKHKCFYCRQASKNKVKILFLVSTKEFGTNLEKSVKRKQDYEMMQFVGDFTKLIENDARYHSSCHSKYIKHKPTAAENVHTKAFEELMGKLLPEFENGRAFDMNEILVKYQDILKSYLPEVEAKKYKRQNMKSRLEKVYGNQLVFYQSNPQKAELVFSKTLQLQDVVNTVSKLKQSLQDIKADEDIATDLDITSEDSILFYASLIIRSQLQKSEGINHAPLDPADISLEQAYKIVPDELYKFLVWTLSTLPPASIEGVGSMADSDPTLHRHVLAIAQDLMYIKSKGRCRTPKHLGLSVTIHQATQSEDLVTFLNRHGHGVSYDEVRRVDTTWAETQTSEADIVIPSNMVPGRITRGAGDNFNRATESLDGKHHDVVNMVLYQQDGEFDVQQVIRQGEFGPSSRNKTLKKIDPHKILHCPNLGGKQPGPKHLLGKTKTSWYFKCTATHKKIITEDRSFQLLRAMPLKLFEADITRHQVPGWTVYHATLTTKGIPDKTRIGYCPMIPASATEMNTVYTMMKYFQAAFESLGQKWSYVAYDEAIYCKAQQIKWRNPQEFQNDHLEMGGFHRAMNFMGSLGKVMSDSGFEDIVIESGIYGPSTVGHCMSGKAYNRALRMHKLMNEAMSRLKWQAFEEWLQEEDIDLADDDHNAIVVATAQCLGEWDDPESVSRTSADNFTDAVKPLMGLMDEFVKFGITCSDTFIFWENYTNDFSQLLLDYVAAKRNDEREIEYETFAEMLPIDFMSGHVNYARWGTVAVAEANIMKATHPDIHQALSNGHGTVHHTKRPFNGVWHDLGIEQSINKECGKYRHLCTKPEALSKYYLTAHTKAAVAQQTRVMSDMATEEAQEHKEATKSRIKKDEDAIRAIIDVVNTRMVNPFLVEQGASMENKQPLINIFSSTVATEEITNYVCHVREHGKNELTNFINARLSINGGNHFFDPIKKPRIKNFSVLNKPAVSKNQQTKNAINIDRQIFSRLIVIAQVRDINLPSVLEYELASVPLTLFHLDGKMRKTTKSDTISVIEKGIACLTELPPLDGDTLTVIDFMMIIRMICTEKLSCKTFGELSETILGTVLSPQSKYIVVVGDNYTNETSIKSSERARRCGNGVEMQEIRNPGTNTPLPKQRKKMLSNPKNKSNLAHFLMTKWTSPECRQLLPVGHQLILAGGFKDPRKVVVCTSTVVTEVPDLASDHEEADSRMFVHINHAFQTLQPNRVVLWSIDSDVEAICVRYEALAGTGNFFLRTGTANKKRFTPIHLVSQNLGREFSLLLPIIHALSGCDSTSAFSQHGKVSFFNAVKDNPGLQAGLGHMGDHPDKISDAAIIACTKLIFAIYDKISKYDTVQGSINKLRYSMFAKKGLASDRLPPTLDAFMQHLKRVNFQSYIWKNATEPMLNLPSPDGHGWELEQGTLVPVQMTEDAAPKTILEFAYCGQTCSCTTRRCSCKKLGLSCTDVCRCDPEVCSNRVEYELEEN